MKQLQSLVLFLVLSTITYGQFPVQPSPTGSVNTLQRNAGAYEVGRGIVITNFIDTTAANNVSFMKGTPYIEIRTSDNKIWRRNVTATQWVQLGGNSGGGSGIDSTAHYTLTQQSDSLYALFEKRNGGKDTLTFLGIPSGSGSGSGLDSTKWSLKGNIINADSNFIGSTNNQPLNFKVNNINAGTIATSNTSVGYNINNVGTNNALFGVDVLKIATNPLQNSLFGRLIGANSTSMNYTTAMGYGALALSTTSNTEVAIGWAALAKNRHGYYNVGVGVSVNNFNLTPIGDTLIGNTWVGSYSAERQRSGRYNAFYGYGAGRYSTTASRSVFIGPFAGENENGNDLLYIANTGTATPLIKGNFAASTLDINGTLKVTGGTPAIGKIFTSIDANGTGSWVTPSFIFDQFTPQENKRFNVKSGRMDSLYASTSAGGRVVSNGGTVAAEWGAGGGSNFDFHGFAGYNLNRASSYTARSFTDKNYVDSSLTLKTTVSSYGKNAGGDSTILVLSNGTRYAAKDSIGGGGWGLTGNASAVTDFLGTTNNRTMRFRTNNTERMVIDSVGNVGIGGSVTSGNIIFGENTSSVPVSLRYTNKSMFLWNLSASAGEIDLVINSSNISQTGLNIYKHSNTGVTTQLASINSGASRFYNTSTTFDGSGTFNGNLVTNSGALRGGLFYAENNTNSVVTGTNGTQISWNRSSGGGETNYINLVQNNTGRAGDIEFGKYVNSTTTYSSYGGWKGSGSFVIGSTTSSASALLEVTSTTKGLLMPRMTTVQRDAIATPATGLQVFNNTNNTPNYYTGTSWANMGGSVYKTAVQEIGTSENLVSAKIRPVKRLIFRGTTGASGTVQIPLTGYSPELILNLTGTFVLDANFTVPLPYSDFGYADGDITTTNVKISYRPSLNVIQIDAINTYAGSSSAINSSYVAIIEFQEN